MDESRHRGQQSVRERHIRAATYVVRAAHSDVCSRHMNELLLFALQHPATHIHTYIYIRGTYVVRAAHSDVCCRHDLRYRVAKTHRIPYLYRSFSAKVTYI